MEPHENGPEASDDLLQKLRVMREKFGHDPSLLEHLDKTVDALNSIDQTEGNDAKDGGKAD